jgi:undecaprenyl-diphosphatase
VIFRQAAAAFALASFLLLGLNWAAGSHDFHRSLDRIPWFGFMHGITILGDGLFAAAIALWLVLRRATKSEWITFILGFAAAALIPQIGKNLIWPEVLRPYGVVSGIKHSPWFEPARYKSFPSGHSSVGAFFALFLAYRVPAWRGVFFALGIGVGLSRMVLHYHWVHDVVAGWAIGLCVAWLAERTLGPKQTTHGTT